MQSDDIVSEANSQRAFSLFITSLVQTPLYVHSWIDLNTNPNCCGHWHNFHHTAVASCRCLQVARFFISNVGVTEVASNRKFGVHVKFTLSSEIR